MYNSANPTVLQVLSFSNPYFLLLCSSKLREELFNVLGMGGKKTTRVVTINTKKCSRRQQKD